jgi:hypothetical protein
VDAARRLAGDGGGLVAWLSAARPGERLGALLALVAHLPADAAEGILARAWQVADPGARLDVARAIRRLVERVRALGARPRRGWKSTLQRDAFLDLLAAAESGVMPDEALALALEAGLPPRQIEEVMALVATVIASVEVSPPARDLWRRWEERLVPLHPTYLCLALRYAASPEEALAAERSYLASHAGIEGAVDVAAAVDELGPHLIAAPVLSDMLTSRGDDPSALAAILRRARERGLGLPIQRAVAHVLLVVAGAPARRGTRPGDVEAGIALARELVGRVPPRRRGRRGGQRRRRTAAEPAHGSRSGEQLPIFGKEST